MAGEKKPEAVDHPRHYNAHPSGVECVDIAEAFGFNIGNAIKYCWRAGLKSADPLEDLRKGAWYLQREIARLTPHARGVDTARGADQEEARPEEVPALHGPGRRVRTEQGLNVRVAEDSVPNDT